MQRRLGFTLVELSIVLVIVALVIGGVVSGKELIEVSRVRAELSQIDKFRIAEETFKAKYGFIPGDIPSEVAQRFRFPINREPISEVCGTSTGMDSFRVGVVRRLASATLAGLISNLNGPSFSYHINQCATTP